MTANERPIDSRERLNSPLDKPRGIRRPDNAAALRIPEAIF
jgi:hypothetical protein